MIHLHKAPDRSTNSENREFLSQNLPQKVRVNGYFPGKWEFELQENQGETYPTIGTVSTDLRRIKIKLNDDKSIPDWVIALAQKIVDKTKTDVDIFLE